MKFHLGPVAKSQKKMITAIKSGAGAVNERAQGAVAFDLEYNYGPRLANDTSVCPGLRESPACGTMSFKTRTSCSP